MTLSFVNPAVSYLHILRTFAEPPWSEREITVHRDHHDWLAGERSTGAATEGKHTPKGRHREMVTI